MIGYIDLGSNVVTLKAEIAEQANIHYQKEVRRLRGFGNGICETLGKQTLLLKIGEVELEAEVLIVPNEAQTEAVLIGQTALGQPDIRIVKEKGLLTITRIPAENYKNADEHQVKRIVEYERVQHEDVKVNEEMIDAEKQELYKLLDANRCCFATNMNEVGTTDWTGFHIQLKDKEPVNQRPYRLAYVERDIMRQKINELLEAGVIQESTSEYSSPALLVKKPNNDYRLCIDYRRLNEKTVTMKFPMPRIEDQLDSLSGSRYFITLDLAAGYHQILVQPESRRFTSFVTPFGQFEFLKMPFGVVNGPAVFNQLMQKVVKRMKQGDVLVYMDDILIPARTIKDGMDKLQRLFVVLKEAGLTLRLEKCVFFTETIEYLGYEVDKEGIRPGKRKTDAISKFDRPKNVHQVRQFLGLTSYFRKFVPGFATIAKPLTELTKNNSSFLWSERQDDAFQALKSKLTEAPILALYDVNAEHEVDTDASKDGLAGILLQKKDMEEAKPVAYYSRQTTATEKGFHSYELETLAVVEAVDKFRVYLLHKHFRILTDCNALKLTMKKKEILPRVGRWLLRLQEYTFTVDYRPGKMMRHVDALSRNPSELPAEMDVVGDKTAIRRIEQDDWLRTMQHQDETLRRICDVLGREPEDNEERQIHTDYKIHNHRLFRCAEGELKWVVPHGAVWKVIHDNHDRMGHFSEDKTLEQIRKYFWFPKMRRKVKKYIAACIACAYHKRPGGKKGAELHNIERTTVPFQTINVDHLGPYPKSKRGNTHVLAIQNNFTKFIILRAVKNTEAKPTCQLMHEVTGLFGCPKYVITDRGTAFTAKRFEDWCKTNDIIHIRNATATPRANGQVERSNATVASAVNTMTQEEREWDENIRDVQYAMNSMKNKTTKRSPHELLFNFDPRNALQNVVTLALQDDRIQDGDVEQLRSEALKNIERSQRAQKIRFDKRHKKPWKYKVGELVLVERDNPATGEPKKLAAKFRGPYMVIEELPHDRYRLGDVPGAQRTQRSFNSVFASDRMKPWCALLKADPDDQDSDEESSVGDPQLFCSQVNIAPRDEEDPGSEDGSGCQERPTVSQYSNARHDEADHVAPLQPEATRQDGERLSERSSVLCTEINKCCTGK